MTGEVVRAALSRGVALAVTWWAVAEGDPYGWRYVAPVVLVATATSLRLLPPRRPAAPLPGRAVAVLRLAAYFTGRSLVAGVDVARRALTRPPDLTPGVVEYALRLPPGFARVVVADMLSLMPGTLCVALRGGVMQVHVLDIRAPVAEQVAALEERVGRTTGWSPPP